jgi:uncharacterized protein YabN with tetrapyrrole methylase and pyrophosphatase domain
MKLCHLKFRSPNHPLDKFLKLQYFQLVHTPYGRINPNYLLFGNDYRSIIKSLGIKANQAGEIGEFYEQLRAKKKDRDSIFDEFSDFLCQVINLGMNQGINIKKALMHGYSKRLSRLQELYRLANNENIQINKSMNIKNWIKLWKISKLNLAKKT